MSNQDFRYLNKVQISGNVGGDLEVKEDKNGSKYGILSIAQNIKSKDEEGNELKVTKWFSVFLWNEGFESWSGRIAKGSFVEANGYLTVNGDGDLFISVKNPKGLKVVLTGKAPDTETSTESVTEAAEQSEMVAS